MPLADYLATTYEPNGRVYPQLDCYGLARLAAAELFGSPLLPENGHIPISDRESFTAAWRQDTARRTTSRPKPGALVAAYSGGLCCHFGLVVDVDGRSMILETTEGTGPRLTKPRFFESRFPQVIYYAD